MWKAQQQRGQQQKGPYESERRREPAPREERRVNDEVGDEQAGRDCDRQCNGCPCMFDDAPQGRERDREDERGGRQKKARHKVGQILRLIPQIKGYGSKRPDRPYEKTENDKSARRLAPGLHPVHEDPERGDGQADNQPGPLHSPVDRGNRRVARTAG